MHTNYKQSLLCTCTYTACIEIPLTYAAIVMYVRTHVHVCIYTCMHKCRQTHIHIWYASRKSVRKVGKLPLKYYAARAKCICSARVLLLEVHDCAAKRISATRTTYQRFCRPMSPLSLYLVASLNSSSFSLASLLCADRSITHAIIRNNSNVNLYYRSTE